MRWMIAAAVALLLSGQKELPSTAPETPERIRILAVHATNEGRVAPEMDPTLAPAAAFLETLPFDTFREVAFHDLETPYGEETTATLNDTYTIHCRPERLTQESEVVLEAWVTMNAGGQTLEALRVTGRAERGQGMAFRGFAMPVGELVVMLSVAEAPTEGGGGGSTDSNGQGGESSSGGGESSPSGNASGSGGDESDPGTPEEAEPNVPEDGEEEPPPMRVGVPVPKEDGEGREVSELANIEAILRALEEIDQREQAKGRKRRYETQGGGGAWW